MIYLDYAATTPLDPRVLEKMLPYLSLVGYFANAASSHLQGQKARSAIENARAQIATSVGAKTSEIIFTSGATEANNLAIKGVAKGYPYKGRHLITTRLEHRSILDPCQQLEREGFEITYLETAPNGILSPETLAAAIRPDTLLVTLMHANNEIGVLQPIEKIGQITRSRGVLLHIDAAQSAGKIPLHFTEWPIDLMSFSAHKIYGPKGIGALAISSQPRVHLSAQMHGGGQESGLRSGTLATHQIVGMGEAFALASAEMQADNAHALQLQSRLWEALQTVPGLILNTDFAQALPNLLNISVEGVGGESLLSDLSEIAVSSGAACHSVSIEPSYVLRALGRSYDLAESSLRFSWGRFTTAAEIDGAVQQFKTSVAKLRHVSPRWKKGNVGTCDIHDKNVEIGVGGGLESGKIIQISLCITPEQTIADAKFKAQGCAATLACGSWLTVAVLGKSIEAAKNITGKHIAEALKLSPEKYHCAMLAEIALQEALKGKI